jgi:hypothetical protein
MDISTFTSRCTHVKPKKEFSSHAKLEEENILISQIPLNNNTSN